LTTGNSARSKAGAAAIAVACAHIAGFWSGLLSHAYLAVDLFFLISGVVIGHAYDVRLCGGWSPAQFMAVRLKRLAPLYFVGLLLGAFRSQIAHTLGYGGDGSVALNLAIGLAFIPALLGGGDLYPLNSPCWSLFDEMLANLAYGAIARTLTERLLKIFVCLGLASLCVVALRSEIAANLGVSGTNWLGGIARVSFSFPLGLLLHRLDIQWRLVRWRIPAPLLVLFEGATFVIPGNGPFYDLTVIALVYPTLIVGRWPTNRRARQPTESSASRAL